jgi:predicted MarR family transcription regulator
MPTDESILEQTDAEQLTELELTLTVLWNSVRRWMSQQSNSDGINGLSELDVFLVHLLVYRNRKLRATDLAFALSIDDMHLVTYALKKLVRLGLVTSNKIGKEVFYNPTDAGKAHYEDFHEARRKYLEPSMSFIPNNSIDIEKINHFLRALSGMYEQAARSAASSRG